MITVRTPRADALDATQLPDLIRLQSGATAACFALMKLLPARHMIDLAVADGDLVPGRTRVMETTSGTFGLGLAMVCALRGLDLTLVTDPVVDVPFRNKLEALGATVDVVSSPAAHGGYQQARLDRLTELAAAEDCSWVPRQYDNGNNPDAYAPVAELLLESLGKIDFLVGCVGSGGSMCGIAGVLRSVLPDLVAIGVDTHGSVLFGMPDRPRLLRGLGNSLLPPNVDHTIFDEVHWVNAAEAFGATRQLFRREALFRGPTSGAAHLVADWVQRRHPNATVAVVMADEGSRYLDTVYNLSWLSEQGCLPAALPDSPITVTEPVAALAAGSWSRFDWNRRGYRDLVPDAESVPVEEVTVDAA
ncbi:cysteine synthase family protein [Microlunatus soli]|uniref:Cysteine synthase A n=1 Tax=Microlunatus soli TaxID=630515 RepID=A0A1H1VV34_9ACTN|nr:cysteine synthase family protein [Microlunatus soli]SDS88642.1 cysteine synthase A [Microlunatus soli]